MDTRKQFQELLKTQPLWAVHYNLDSLLEMKPSKVIRITKRFVYTEDGKHSSSMGIYRSEEIAWDKIVAKLKLKTKDRDSINALYDRLNNLKEEKPSLFV